MEEAGFRLVLSLALRPGFFRDEDGMGDQLPRVQSGNYFNMVTSKVISKLHH